MKTTSVITKLIDHHLTNGTERAYVTITMSMNQRVFMPRTNKFASRKDAFSIFFLFPTSIDPLAHKNKSKKKYNMYNSLNNYFSYQRVLSIHF